MEQQEEAEVINEEIIVVPESAPKRDSFLAISIIIAAVLVGGSIVFSAVYGHGSSGAPSGPPSGNGAGATTGTANAAIATLGSRDAILGNANAPVTLIEYGDYQCPFCSAFFQQTEPQVISNYVNKGKVKMVFRNFAFLGPESIAAAAAAECANDQGKLWPYHDALYQAKLDDEAKGGGENDGSFNRTLFLKLATNVGLSTSQFTSCIDSNKYGALVAQEKTTATNAGVNSTPSFFVDGKEIVDSTGNSVGANGPAILQALDTAVKS